MLPSPPGQPAATKVAAKARIIMAKRISEGLCRLLDFIVQRILEGLYRLLDFIVQRTLED